MIVSLKSLWQYDNCQRFQGEAMVKPSDIDALKLRVRIRAVPAGRALRRSR